MASKVIDEARLTINCDAPIGQGDYVLYWMQASVRTRDNHALEYAVQLANDGELPLVVREGAPLDVASRAGRGRGGGGDGSELPPRAEGMAV